MQRVYLDHAATSPLRPEAAEAMQRAWQLVGNPSSLHSDGRAAAKLLEQCRDRVAKVFTCRSNDVIFNSGGSEGDTHALFGAAELLNAQLFGVSHPGVARRPLRIAVSAIEHRAVLHAAEKLSAFGHSMLSIPVSDQGVIEVDWLEKQLAGGEVDIVSVMAVNNELGTIQPVNDVAALCLKHQAIYHCDAVQAPGHGLSALLQDPTLPLLTISAHKFGGPKGAGVLIARRRTLAQALEQPSEAELPALICGGHQEHGCRAGTENVAGAAGLVAALEIAENDVVPEKQPCDNSSVLRHMRDFLESTLIEGKAECRILAYEAERASHISAILLSQAKASDLQRRLDRKGIAIGVGSACSNCGRESSHVLHAIGLNRKDADHVVRVSLGWHSTAQDVHVLLEAIGELIRG